MLIFDLETDGLLDELTTIHTLTIYSTASRKYTRYDKKDVPCGLKRLQTAEAIMGHNIIAFDIPAIQKVVPGWTPKGQVVDTLVWSRLIVSDIKDTDFGLFKKGVLPGQLIGSHSLEAWGYRLGEYKGDYGKTTDWATWTPEMSDYCEQDVRVTVALYKYLDDITPSDIKGGALDLEHKVAYIIARQERHGFYFDQEKANKLYQKLLIKRVECIEKLQKIFPPFFVPNGNKEFIPKRDNKKTGYIAGAPCCKIKQIDFNPKSNYHVYWMLNRKYGWEPTEWTPSGQPKVDEDILLSLTERYPEVEDILNYWIVDKRMSQLQDGDKAWMKFLKADDSRIHGTINPCGTVTGRMTHYNPNMSQVPAGYSPYGGECRELFCVPPGHKLVGCDASGLEGRMLAHYLAAYDGGEYAKAVLEGRKEDGTDIHTLNMKALGIDSRDDAKKWFYAWLYGAGDNKLADLLGITLKQAKAKRQLFLQNLPALAKLKDAIEKTVKKRGYLKGLDGRRLKIRSIHSALNTLLQSAGAIVMKKALIILDNDLIKQGFIPGVDYEFCANSHDEWQIEVTDPENVVTVGETARTAIQKAGVFFNLRCPLDGEYKIGNSWKETH